MREIRFVEALREALHEEMRRDERVYVIGEAVGPNTAGFRATSGLFEEFGPGRVRVTPLAETVLAGSCVGAAVAGYRPVADMMLADFMFPALDEIMSKAGKWRYTHGANCGMTLPIVFRTVMGGYGGGASEHSQAPLGLFMHAQGLKLAVPSNAYDAKGLLKTAIRDDNPVVFFEHRLLYSTRGSVPDEEYTVPFGQAVVRREGTDATVVATAYMVSLSLQAATELEKEGINIEVIDPRTLEPLDIDTILTSVKKTGRLVIVDEDARRCSVGAEIGMQVVERGFDLLDAPIQRVANPDLPVPYSEPLWRAVLPQVSHIVAAVKATLAA